MASAPSRANTGRHLPRAADDRRDGWAVPGPKGRHRLSAALLSLLPRQPWPPTIEAQPHADTIQQRNPQTRLLP